MDWQQQRTEELLQREIAWFHYRDLIEDILELPRDALDGMKTEPV